MPRKGEAYEESLEGARKKLEESKKSIKALDDVLNKFGVTLDDISAKFRVVNQTINVNKKGISSVYQTLQYHNEELATTLKLKGKINKEGEFVPKTLTETPDKPQPIKPEISSLADYSNIKETAQLVSEQTTKLADNSERLVQVFKVVDETGTTTYKAINKKIIDVNKNLKESNKLKDKNNKKQEEVNKKTSKFAILLNRIKTISIYRAIRRSLQIITQSFIQGIDAIASYNSEFSGTMSKITTALDKAKMASSVAFYQVLIALEPVITRISNVIVELANNISKVLANMRGSAEYTQINTKYMKEYKSALQSVLAPYDQFLTLSGGNGIDPSKIFETKTDAKDALTPQQERLKTIFELIKQITEAVSEIWITIKPSIEPILEFVVDIIKGISKLIKWLKDKNLLTPALIGLLAIVIAIKAPLLAIVAAVGLAIDAFGKMDSKTKVLTAIVAGLAAALAATFAILLTTGGIVAKTIAAITAASVTFAGVSTIIAQAQSKTNGFYDGGVPDKSELFYMNEYGKPEAMMNLGGQTNVINQNQLQFSMKEGFKEAFVELGLLEMLSDQRIVLEGRDIDNSAVARGLFNALKTESKRRGGNQL